MVSAQALLLPLRDCSGAVHLHVCHPAIKVVSPGTRALAMYRQGWDLRQNDLVDGGSVLRCLHGQHVEVCNSFALGSAAANNHNLLQESHQSSVRPGPAKMILSKGIFSGLQVKELERRVRQMAAIHRPSGKSTNIQVLRCNWSI